MKDETIPSHGTAAGDHPAPETLLAYRDDRLPAGEAETLREHLADCADCAGLVLELAGDAGDAADELSDVDLERAWRRARPRLARPPRRESGWPRTPWPALLAASLLLAVVPLLFFGGGDDPDRVSALSLSPLDAARGQQALEPCNALAAGADVWRLTLPVRDETRAGPGLRLEILTADRRLVATRDVAATGDGVAQVELRRGGLDAGRYLLYLVDPAPPEPVLLERYCVEIFDG